MLARVLRGTGETMITAGVVVLLFVVYLLYWTDLENSLTQQGLHDDLRSEWAAPTPAATTGPAAAPRPGTPAPSVVPTVPLGHGLAVLRIPRLGRDYDPVVVEGVSTDDLQQGPGHYPRTALPGEKGNFVVSGHRTTWGKPFNRLDEVRPDDMVVVETRSSWVTYRVVGLTVVDPDAGAVIGDRPPPIGAQPPGADRLLTFTTCNPKFSAAQRLILRGVWTATDAKRPGFLPPALAA